MNYAIGVDIGGGSTKIGLISSKGEIVDKERLVVDKNDKADAITHQYAHIIRAICARQARCTPIGIGIGFPGLIHPDNLSGYVGNIPALDNYPLAQNLGQIFSCPARMENDAMAACMAESLYGKNAGVSRLLMMTAGTGIGVAMTIDNHPLRVSGGCLGDAGHLIVNVRHPRTCRQGSFGGLESVASGQALSEAAAAFVADNPESPLAVHARLSKKQADSADVIYCAGQGDKQSMAMLAQIGTWLGQAAASWCHIFTPQLIVLGGGLSAAGALLLDPIEREARRRAIPAHMQHVIYNVFSEAKKIICNFLFPFVFFTFKPLGFRVLSLYKSIISVLF